MFLVIIIKIFGILADYFKEISEFDYANSGWNQKKVCEKILLKSRCSDEFSTGDDYKLIKTKIKINVRE